MREYTNANEREKKHNVKINMKDKGEKGHIFFSFVPLANDEHHV